MNDRAKKNPCLKILAFRVIYDSLKTLNAFIQSFYLETMKPQSHVFFGA